MVDYSALRRKFPVKDPDKRRRVAAIKAIAREYELKKAELGASRAPVMKRGVVFYVVVVIGLMMLGALVLSATGRGGRARIDRAMLDVRKSVDNLALALGRYRYHVGEYPSTEEGLEALASTKITRRGWNGPYIRQVVKDPWGRDYVYVRNGAAETPTLYSKGPDGLAGTTDDIIPDPALFDAPFRDTSWTQGWMPYQLRGYVLAPDEKAKAAIEKEVDGILHPVTVPAAETELALRSLEITFPVVTEDTATVRIRYDSPAGAVTNDVVIQSPVLWTPERPFLYTCSVGGGVARYAIRTTEFAPDGGFLLNGKPYALKGIQCRQDETTLFGRTFERDVARRVLAALKDVGANAVCPGPCDPRFIDLCDEMGLLVWNGGGFDRWHAPDASAGAPPSGNVPFDAEFSSLVLDHDLLPNENYHLVRAEWNRRAETVRLLTHWTRGGSEGNPVTVVCATSGDAAELFLNGESLGRRTAPAGPRDGLRWQVPYEPGELKVIASRDGSPIGEDVVHTAYRPVAVRLTSDTETLADGEIGFVTVGLEDEYGTEVPTAQTNVKFTLEGPGEFVAAANGSTAEFWDGSDPCSLENGRALVIVRRTKGSGLPLRLTASVDGLRSAVLVLPRR